MNLVYESVANKKGAIEVYRFINCNAVADTQ